MVVIFSLMYKGVLFFHVAFLAFHVGLEEKVFHVFYSAYIYEKWDNDKDSFFFFSVSRITYFLCWFPYRLTTCQEHHSFVITLFCTSLSFLWCAFQVCAHWLRRAHHQPSVLTTVNSSAVIGTRKHRVTVLFNMFGQKDDLVEFLSLFHFKLWKEDWSLWYMWGLDLRTKL